MENTSFVVFAQAGDGSVNVTGPVASAPETTTNQTQQVPDGQTSDSAGNLNNQQRPSDWTTFFPIIIVIVVMIAISMRTSSKERKKREEMMNSIRKGTKIMTSGGILGEIAEVQKDQFLLKVANNVQIAISRSAVAQVIEPSEDTDDKKKAEVTKK